LTTKFSVTRFSQLHFNFAVVVHNINHSYFITSFKKTQTIQQQVHKGSQQATNSAGGQSKHPKM
jgi:hypothetical protein